MKLNYNSPNAKLYRWFYNIDTEYNMPFNKCNLVFRCIIMYILFLPLFAFCIPGIIAGLVIQDSLLIGKDKEDPSLKEDFGNTWIILMIAFILYMMYLPIKYTFIGHFPYVHEDGIAILAIFGIMFWIVLLIIIGAYINSNWKSFKLPKFLSKHCDDIEWYNLKKQENERDEYDW